MFSRPSVYESNTNIEQKSLVLAGQVAVVMVLRGVFGIVAMNKSVSKEGKGEWSERMFLHVWHSKDIIGAFRLLEFPSCRWTFYCAPEFDRKCIMCGRYRIRESAA